jgi:acyl-CoA reductase-like NAD-dependent aldehyde dehydrogenase
MGPLVSREQYDRVLSYVELGKREGKLACGGGRAPGFERGHFVQPTIFVDVDPGARIAREEIFGPVAVVIPFDDEKDAIRLANHTVFGLGAAVFTRDLERGERIARHELQAGSCFVNAFVRSDPRLPFGGIRESGYGRELGAFGIREFVNVKTVYVA